MPLTVYLAGPGVFCPDAEALAKAQQISLLY